MVKTDERKAVFLDIVQAKSKPVTPEDISQELRVSWNTAQTYLQERNHTKEFWEIVKNAMPNYEEKKEWLRVNGPGLTYSKTR